MTDLDEFQKRMDDAPSRRGRGLLSLIGEAWRILRASRKRPELIKLGVLQSISENPDAVTAPVKAGARTVAKRAFDKQNQRIEELSRR